MTKFHAKILKAWGVQKKNPNMFTVGNSTNATYQCFFFERGHGVENVDIVWRTWCLRKNDVFFFFNWDDVVHNTFLKGKMV